jgi:prenyltransferase beta subunit
MSILFSCPRPLPILRKHDIQPTRNESHNGDDNEMRPYKAVRLICILVLSTVLAQFAGGQVRATDANKIDLSATLKYVKDWAARDTYPDSPSFAYQNIYCQIALDGKVSDSDKQRLIEFLAKSQKQDGGFVTNPSLEQGSNVIFTYFALAALDLIDATSAIDKEKAAGFVLSLAQKDGGIKAAAKDANAYLGTTYYGVRALALLKALDRIDRDRTIAYIKSHRDGAKGFGVLAGKPSAPQSTFMAVESLKLLGGLTEEIRPGVIEFFKETPYAGFKEPENLALMSVENTAHALGTATILSAVQQLNTEKIYEFVESLYIPENGGFGPSPGLGTTPPSSFYAVMCLVRLGKLEDPHAARAGR